MTITPCKYRETVGSRSKIGIHICADGNDIIIGESGYQPKVMFNYVDYPNDLHINVTPILNIIKERIKDEF